MLGAKENLSVGWLWPVICSLSGSLPGLPLQKSSAVLCTVALQGDRKNRTQAQAVGESNLGEGGSRRILCLKDSKLGGIIPIFYSLLTHPLSF